LGSLWNRMDLMRINFSIFENFCEKFIKWNSCRPHVCEKFFYFFIFFCAHAQALDSDLKYLFEFWFFFALAHQSVREFFSRHANFIVRFGFRFDECDKKIIDPTILNRHLRWIFIFNFFGWTRLDHQLSYLRDTFNVRKKFLSDFPNPNFSKMRIEKYFVSEFFFALTRKVENHLDYNFR
jgi:hypothetical protein